MWTQEQGLFYVCLLIYLQYLELCLGHGSALWKYIDWINLTFLYVELMNYMLLLRMNPII